MPGVDATSRSRISSNAAFGQELTFRLGFRYDEQNAADRTCDGEAAEEQEESVIVSGACHCGNISFELTWEPEPSEIPARACSCSFCAKHRGVWTSNPSGALRVSIADPRLVSRYVFGTRTAQFHVCARCGVVPLVTSSLDEHLYAVVNVNTFNNVEPSLLSPSPVSFEGESVESRLARRRRNWISNVQFVEPTVAN